MLYHKAQYLVHSPTPSSFFFPRMVRLLISTELVFIAVKMTAELCISVTAGDLLKIKG